MSAPVRAALLVGTIGLVAVCVAYPYLPGGSDRLAAPLSALVQLVGVAGVLPALPAVAWLGYEMRKRSRRRRGLPAAPHRRGFAMTVLVVGSVVAIPVAMIALSDGGVLWLLLVAAAWLVVVVRAVPGLRAPRDAEPEGFSAVPLYVVLVPVTVLAMQVAAGPLTDLSRDRAVEHGATLIEELEGYRDRTGGYPESLEALYPDYATGVVGIPRYEYARRGAAYDLGFEQPRFLLDDFGAREVVVYNPHDEPRAISHASWILAFDPDELEANQGWFAEQDTGHPGWRSFLFD